MLLLVLCFSVCEWCSADCWVRADVWQLRRVRGSFRLSIVLRTCLPLMSVCHSCKIRLRLKGFVTVADTSRWGGARRQGNT